MREPSLAAVQGAKSVLFSLPIVTVAVIAFAIFVVGAPRPYVGARVYGGPTEGASVLSVRVSFVRRYAEVEEPADVGPFALEVRSRDGRARVATGTTDAQGMASVAVEVPGGPAAGPVRLRVTEPGEPPSVRADQDTELTIASWNEGAREHGGWLSGARQGELRVRVAPGRGVLAVPFPEPLWLEVRNAAGPVADAELGIDAEGLAVAEHPKPLRSDRLGRALVVVSPREHVVSLRVEATAPSGAKGQWYGSLPVVGGAMRAALQDGKLRIESPTERDFAYWALIHRRGRVAGGRARLDLDGRGGAVALVDLPEQSSSALWAVVSSEPELDSASSVGWPLRPPKLDDPMSEPPLARAVPDRLLADGLHIGFALESARRTKARRLALGFSLLAALLAAALLTRETGRAAARLDQHLREAGADQDLADRIGQKRSRWLRVVIALLCVGMGFAVLALVALYRIG